jgi:hypothetical protein
LILLFDFIFTTYNFSIFRFLCLFSNFHPGIFMKDVNSSSASLVWGPRTPTLFCITNKSWSYLFKSVAILRAKVFCYFNRFGIVYFWWLLSLCCAFSSHGIMKIFHIPIGISMKIYLLNNPNNCRNRGRLLLRLISKLYMLNIYRGGFFPRLWSNAGWWRLGPEVKGGWYHQLVIIHLRLQPYKYEC